MKTALIVTGIAMCLYLWGVRSRKRLRRKGKVVLAGREGLSPESFYERFFNRKAVPPALVERLRVIFEQETGEDLSQLTTTESLAIELKALWDMDSLADVVIISRIEEEFGMTITQADAERIFTFGDVVEIVWSKVEQKNLV